MYSRYSGISIPKNYSGSRFSSLEEPETKTHRATTVNGPIKSAHSPSFMPMGEPVEDETAGDVADFEEFSPKDEELDASLDEESFAYGEEGEEAVDTGREDKGDEGDKSSFLKSILSGLEKDELILLGLILLLISDSQDNTDIVMILVLLLVNGK